MAYSTHLIHTDPNDRVLINRDPSGDIAVTVFDPSGSVVQRIELVSTRDRARVEVSL